MAGFRNFFSAGFRSPPDDITPCVIQANSFREVVSLQALFVTLTVALLAYVNSVPAFQVRVDALFADIYSPKPNPGIIKHLNCQTVKRCCR